MYIINLKNKSIYGYFNHVLYDGCKVINYFLKDIIPFYKKKYIFKLNKPKYYFFFTELLCIYNFLKLINFKKNQLKVKKSILMNNENVIYHKYDINYLKKLKKNSKIKTISIVVSFYLKKIFDNLRSKKKYLNICILGGFENDRFNNNYTFIKLQVKNTNLNDMIYYIDNTIKSKKLDGLINYYLTQTFDFFYNVESINKKSTDVLFSPLYFLGDYESKHIELFSRFHSSSLPIYISCIGDKNKITYSTHIRTNDINLDTFKKDSIEVDF